MLLSGGLFVGGVAAIAWERVPAWRATDLVDFRTGFAHPLRRVDRLQPALLVVCLGSAIGVASSTSGAARTLALLAAGGLLVVLVGSVAWLVPIQRRLVASGPPPPSADLEALRARWCGGHLLRRAVRLACFVLAVVATARAGRPSRELPELGTVDGIVDIGFALGAWFVDPTTTGSVCSSSRSRSGDQPRPPRITLARRANASDHPAPDHRQSPPPSRKETLS
jgi:hypothetical protein